MKALPINSVKYLRLDLHQATISTAVLDAVGKLVMESVVATTTAVVFDLLGGVPDTPPSSTTCRFAVWPEWGPSNPHRNVLLKAGTINVKQLAGSYAALTEDTAGVMRRLKALCRSQAIPTAGNKT